MFSGPWSSVNQKASLSTMIFVVGPTELLPMPGKLALCIRTGKNPKKASFFFS